MTPLAFLLARVSLSGRHSSDGVWCNARALRRKCNAKYCGPHHGPLHAILTRPDPGVPLNVGHSGVPHVVHLSICRRTKAMAKQ